MKKVKKKIRRESINKETGSRKSFSQKTQTYICAALLVFVIAIYFSPLIFDSYRPGGVDVIGSTGKGNQVAEWTEKTGITDMWNPAIFSGMPSYHRWGGKIWNMDTFIYYTVGFLFYAQIFYYFLGAFGMFFLMKYLKKNNMIALFTAFAFTFLAHWGALLEIGHFTKFRAIMLIPFALWAFLRLLDKPGILNLAFYVLIQSVQVRTQHYQIIFYTALLFGFIGIWKIIEYVKAKENLKLKIIFMLAALVLIVGVVAQPLFVMNEFTPYSIRGGTGGEDDSKGLDMSYATSWSFHPAETFNFIIPRYFGGASQETYDVSNPQYGHLKNKKIPGYWGHMPFTQATEYIGIVIVFFAILGLAANYRKRFIITLALLGGFAYLLSFGRHFPAFYEIFFNNMPAFNKFRVPSMILMLVDFVAVVLAGYGLNSLVRMVEQDERKEIIKLTIITSSVMLAFVVIAYATSGSLDFMRDQDMAQYQGQSLEMIKNIRQELLMGDLQRAIILIIVTIAAVFVYIFRVIKNKTIAIAIFTVLMLFDLFQINGRFLMEKVNGKYTNLHDIDNLKKSHFKKTQVDEFLLSQKDSKLEFADYRIYPVVQNIWSSNDYSYLHQSIGGYSPAKMRIYQDLMDYGRAQNMSVFSRNIPNMLNAKYYIVEGRLPETYPFENIQPVFSGGKQIVYENKEACGRGWFVGNYKVAETRAGRFELLNNPDFDVRKEAILEIDPKLDVHEPGNASVELQKLNPHELEFTVKNDSSSIFVVSEVYYPNGWYAFIDGKETEIFKTNHVLRSIYVPAGEHKIELRFEPPTLVASMRVSLVSTIIVFGLFVFGLLQEYRKREE